MIKGGNKSYFISTLLVGVQFACLFFLIATGPVFDFTNYAFLLESFSILLALWAFFVMKASRLNVFPDVLSGAILIRKGPYRIIRHPMYLAVILFALSILFMFFSGIRLTTFLLLILDLLVKIEYEEKLLEAELDGYKEYKLNSYKLIPLLY
jgi:protein-S-isoprenylcysteine O-methyltransferase Ste14